MKGKEKCKALKEIRKQIAEKNDIEFIVSECTHKGDCKGTCPKCEAELRYLEKQLEIRKSLGKAVAVAGISVGTCTMMTACTPLDVVSRLVSDVIHPEQDWEVQGMAEPLSGDVILQEPINEEGALPEPEETTDIAGDMDYIPPAESEPFDSESSISPNEGE